MVVLKVIMREGNIVVCISIILSFLSLCWKSWSCTYFAFICLLLCAFMTCFFTRFLFIGSGLDLKVFHTCFLMLSFASTLISYESIIEITMPILMAIKKELSGDNPLCFTYNNFLFCLSLGSFYYCSNLSLSCIFRFLCKSSLYVEVNKIWGSCCPENRFCAVTKKIV